MTRLHASPAKLASLWMEQVALTVSSFSIIFVCKTCPDEPVSCMSCSHLSFWDCSNSGSHTQTYRSTYRHVHMHAMISTIIFIVAVYPTIEYILVSEIAKILNRMWHQIFIHSYPESTGTMPVGWKKFFTAIGFRIRSFRALTTVILYPLIQHQLNEIRFTILCETHYEKWLN